MTDKDMNTIFSSDSNEWATPQYLFDKLNEEFHFTLDPAASDENHKCDKYYTIEEDGLQKSWGGETVFCNPPYGRGIGKWLEKAYNESQKPNTPVVLLVFARTDTKWFHKYVYGKAEIRFIEGRIKFGSARNNAPAPSMIVIYKTN